MALSKDLGSLTSDDSDLGRRSSGQVIRNIDVGNLLTLAPESGFIPIEETWE
jgi:hypothetical protein